MKHSCGTVALDGLLILDSTKKKKTAESYGSAATQNTTVSQPCWANITIYKIVQTNKKHDTNWHHNEKYMTNVCLTMSAIFELTQNKTKTLINMTPSYFIHTQKTKIVGKNFFFNYIFHRFSDFAPLLAV